MNWTPISLCVTPHGAIRGIRESRVQFTHGVGKLELCEMSLVSSFSKWNRFTVHVRVQLGRVFFPTSKQSLKKKKCTPSLEENNMAVEQEREADGDYLSFLGCKMIFLRVALSWSKSNVTFLFHFRVHSSRYEFRRAYTCDTSWYKDEWKRTRANYWRLQFA